MASRGEVVISRDMVEAYRRNVDSSSKSASSYVKKYMAAFRNAYPESSVADQRKAVMAAVRNAVNVFGDQACVTAGTLFDQVCAAGGIDAEFEVGDVVSEEMIEGRARYLARHLVAGEEIEFDRLVLSTTESYVKRCAFENMRRNCGRAGIRYARVPSGRETCGYCFMLSSRGFVYRSAETAEHGMHAHCDCIVVPGLKGRDSVQIPGYEPDKMYDRWRQCGDTLGGDRQMMRDWEALSREERAKYKGKTDDAKWLSYRNKRVQAECELRDPKWLYTGKAPAWDIADGADPDKYEIATAEVLAKNGIGVTFKPRSLDRHDRRADTTIGDAKYEIKNPAGSGYLCVYNQVKSNLYGENKHIVNPQSDKLIISNVRSNMTLDRMVDDVGKLIRREEGFLLDGFDEMTEIVLVDKGGKIRRVVL